MNNRPTGFLVITPMTVSVGENVHIKIKALANLRNIGNNGAFEWHFPRLISSSNTSPRGITYLDNVPYQWQGVVQIDGGAALDGPKSIDFSNEKQGVFTDDARPIRHCEGWRWNKPGIYFITATDRESGAQGISNPVIVTSQPPAKRIYWGDIHWQSFLTDGLRYPEELYDFARDEAFLDFGGAADHAEGLTDRQWAYFTGVTNDYNRDGSFATLLGFEWTSPSYGHRNIYYPGHTGSIFRSNATQSNTLEKLFSALDNQEALVIPHHSASADMGVNWDLGWNPRYEKAVEIASIWGSSECSALDGNRMPIRTGKGERNGSHVIDALRRGYKFGFIGSGDIHDGRPGDDLSIYQTVHGANYSVLYPQSFVAVLAPSLNRRSVYDCIGQHDTYAATSRSIFLDLHIEGVRMGGDLPEKSIYEIAVSAASTEAIADIELIGDAGVIFRFDLSQDRHVLQKVFQLPIHSSFCYLRLTTKRDNIAWSSPIFIG